MTTPDIVICEFMDDAAVARLSEAFTVVYDPQLVDAPDRLVAAIGNAPALIVRNRTQVRGDLLAAATRLRVVGRLGGGLDNIDQTACAERDIAVIPATGANSDAVAEYVIAAMLSLVRGAFARNADMMAGSWPRSELMGGEVAGRTLGLIGYGGIARAVASRAAALGLSIIAFDPLLAKDDPAWGTTTPLSLDEVCARADILSLHVPLTQTTKHLLDAQRLSALKPGAVVINTARGGVIDDAALADALRNGHLGGAALDVFETEPLTEQAARIFDGVSNVILTPHIAGVTQESNTRVSDMIADRVASALTALSRG